MPVLSAAAKVIVTTSVLPGPSFPEDEIVLASPSLFIFKGYHTWSCLSINAAYIFPVALFNVCSPLPLYSILQQLVCKDEHCCIPGLARHPHRLTGLAVKPFIKFSVVQPACLRIAEELSPCQVFSLYV